MKKSDQVPTLIDMMTGHGSAELHPRLILILIMTDRPCKPGRKDDLERSSLPMMRQRPGTKLGELRWNVMWVSKAALGLIHA